MKLWNVLLIIIFLISILSFTACSKAECEKSSDCRTGNPCIIGRCIDGKCTTTINQDCCGNGVCEANDGENKCTCEKDCGMCEGKVKYNITTTRGIKTLEAQYAQSLCENNICIVGVAASDVNELKHTNEVDVRGGFKAEVLTVLNTPFDISKESINVRVTLKDLDTDVVDGISFKSIQILSGSELMGEKLINNKLSSVGNLFTEELSLSSAQSIVEEERRIEIKIGYEYVVDERGEQVIKRDDSKNKLTEEIIFIKP